MSEAVIHLLWDLTGMCNWCSASAIASHSVLTSSHHSEQLVKSVHSPKKAHHTGSLIAVTAMILQPETD